MSLSAQWPAVEWVAVVSVPRPLPWVAAVAVAAAISLCWLAAYLSRHRGRPGATWFMAALVAQAVWCFAYGAGVLVTDPTWRVTLEVVSWLGLTWVGYLFLGFALDYTGRSDLRQSPLYVGLGVVPAVGTALLLTSPYHGLFWTDATAVRVLGAVALEYTFQPAALVVILVGMAYAGLGVFLLADAILSYGPLYRREAVAVAVSTVPPTVGLLVWLLDVGPASALNWGVVLSLPHAALDAYAFVGNGMFETSPTTRRVADEAAIDVFPDPVVVIDDQGRLVDFNGAAATVFDGLTTAAIGTQASAALPLDFDTTADQYVSPFEGESSREYRLRPVALTDPRGVEVGRIVLFQDITHEREREQRLEVLNRVLRHNLRNKLTAITGRADYIGQAVDDPEIARLADAIGDSGQELAAIGDKARAFDELKQSESAFGHVDVGPLLDEIRDDFASRYEHATINTTVETDEPVYTNPSLLRLALENVVENALEHAGNADTQIWIVVTEANQEGYSLAIDVHDEGPGLPESELAVIRQGSETDLEHGTGIGLWIVKWCLRRLGGVVSFDHTAAGTSVTFWIPDSPPTDHGASHRVDEPTHPGTDERASPSRSSGRASNSQA